MSEPSSNLPAGLVGTWPTCVWAAQHSAGPWLCVYRVGNAAAIVWRTYAFFKSTPYHVVDYDGPDGVESAIEHARLLLDDVDAAPQLLLPKNREAERRAKQTESRVGRPRVDPVEKAKRAAERQKAYRERKAAKESAPVSPESIEQTQAKARANRESMRGALEAHGFESEQIDQFVDMRGEGFKTVMAWLRTEAGQRAMQKTQANPG